MIYVHVLVFEIRLNFYVWKFPWLEVLKKKKRANN